MALRMIKDSEIAVLLGKQAFAEFVELSSGRHSDDKQMVLLLVNRLFQRHNLGFRAVDFDSLDLAETTWTVEDLI